MVFIIFKGFYFFGNRVKLGFKWYYGWFGLYVIRCLFIEILCCFKYKIVLEFFGNMGYWYVCVFLDIKVVDNWIDLFYSEMMFLW